MPSGIYKRKAIIKVGDKFSKLTAIKFNYKRNGHQYWLFKCDCGKEKILRVGSVKNGSIKSCGCLRKKLMLKKFRTHGMCTTKIYEIWSSMKKRCLNKNNEHYKDYGGRGITICDKWLKFENFFKDMGEVPKGLTLDRKNNNKGYYKNNCRWANWKQQANNRRKRTIWYRDNTGKFISRETMARN